MKMCVCVVCVCVYVCVCARAHVCVFECKATDPKYNGYFNFKFKFRSRKQITFRVRPCTDTLNAIINYSKLKNWNSSCFLVNNNIPLSLDIIGETKRQRAGALFRVAKPTLGPPPTLLYKKVSVGLHFSQMQLPKKTWPISHCRIRKLQAR